jgi:hypothetical protein
VSTVLRAAETVWTVSLRFRCSVDSKDSKGLFLHNPPGATPDFQRGTSASNKRIGNKIKDNSH